MAGATANGVVQHLIHSVALAAEAAAAHSHKVKMLWLLLLFALSVMGAGVGDSLTGQLAVGNDIGWSCDGVHGVRPAAVAGGWGVHETSRLEQQCCFDAR